jgi:hypothetical protein
LERCSCCCTAEQQEGGRKGKDVQITIQEELSMQRCSHDEDRSGSNPGRGARSPPQQKGMKVLLIKGEISVIEGFSMQIFFNEEADRWRQSI